MKHLLKISLCFLVFALIGVLGVKAQGTTQPSLAIYYGGPVGTEYSFVSPMSGVSVTIDDSFVNPCSYKNYLYLGEGVMLNMTVKFPSVYLAVFHTPHQDGGGHGVGEVFLQRFELLDALCLLDDDELSLRHHRVSARRVHHLACRRVVAVADGAVEIHLLCLEHILREVVADLVYVVGLLAHQ